MHSAQKASGKNPQVLLKRLRQPFAVKVSGQMRMKLLVSRLRFIVVLPTLQIIHPVLQTGPVELCQQKACSHMCVLAPGPVAVCRCPAGLFLAEDGVSCSSQEDDAFLLMLSPSTITKVLLSFQQLLSWNTY